MSRTHVTLLVTPFAFSPIVAEGVPESDLAEARELVERWLDTTFLRRGDAVDDLVRSIGAALAGRHGEAGR